MIELLFIKQKDIGYSFYNYFAKEKFYKVYSN